MALTRGRAESVQEKEDQTVATNFDRIFAALLLCTQCRGRYSSETSVVTPRLVESAGVLSFLTKSITEIARVSMASPAFAPKHGMLVEHTIVFCSQNNAGLDALQFVLSRW